MRGLLLLALDKYACAVVFALLLLLVHHILCNDHLFAVVVHWFLMYHSIHDLVLSSCSILIRTGF